MPLIGMTISSWPSEAAVMCSFAPRTTTRLETTRGLGPYADEITGPNRSGYFNQNNQGKRSVALNLKTERGKELLRDLIATADVVIDNMSAGALGRMGFPFEKLVEINPKIVAVSMTGYGETGPYSGHTAYGSLIDALSGIATSNGSVRGGPTDLVMSLPDPMAGITTAIATLGALYRARATGEPVRVETAMFEACLPAFPWPVLFAGTTGGEVQVIHNRDEARSPHGTFRGRDEDSWVAISVADDDTFATLAKVIDEPGLATDPKFATLPARKLHEDELEAVVSRWTAERTPHRRGRCAAGRRDRRRGRGHRRRGPHPPGARRARLLPRAGPRRDRPPPAALRPVGHLPLPHVTALRRPRPGAAHPRGAG
jgi:benzylsuccinate CoA-transferase BbsF subunit